MWYWISQTRPCSVNGWFDETSGDRIRRAPSQKVHADVLRYGKSCTEIGVSDRSIDDVFHVLMSFWYFRCGPASPKTPSRRSKHQRNQGCRLGDGSLLTGLKSTSTGSAVVRPPRIVVGLRAVLLAPEHVIRRVDDAVAVIVAGQGHQSVAQAVVHSSVHGARREIIDSRAD